MLSSFRSFAHYFQAYPLRGTLTIITVSLGVAALIITFSITSDVFSAIDDSRSETGQRIVIRNADAGPDGTLSPQIPAAFTQEATATLEAEYENLRDMTFVTNGRWSEMSTESTSYQIRSSLSVEPGYERAMGLSIIAGSFLTEEDVAGRAPVLVISSETAQIVFGGVEASIGETIFGAIPVSQGDGRLEIGREPFTVIGVYESLPEFEREAYGVGDILMPLGITGRPGIDVTQTPAAYMVGRLINDSLEAAESRIRATLEVAYGDETMISLWEGNGQGPVPLLEENREAIASFVVTVNVLGLVILLASSIGIFSIMLVEVLGRMREIGLRRALGATRWGIRRFFVGQALWYSCLGGVLGVGLSFVFYRVIGASLLPFFESSGLAATAVGLTAPGLIPTALAVGSAAVIGALFGFFPAISASSMSIVDAIREEAA